MPEVDRCSRRIDQETGLVVPAVLGTATALPFADDRFGKINVVIRRKNGQLAVAQEALPAMPDELKQLLRERT